MGFLDYTVGVFSSGAGATASEQKSEVVSDLGNKLERYGDNSVEKECNSARDIPIVGDAIAESRLLVSKGVNKAGHITGKVIDFFIK